MTHAINVSAVGAGTTAAIIASVLTDSHVAGGVAAIAAVLLSHAAAGLRLIR
jgi:hypothetical protein